jgi:Zn2+/Cd2+-exporting ATPase
VNSAASHPPKSQSDDRCLAEVFAHRLIHNPALEAVTVQPARDTLAIARMTKDGNQALEEMVVQAVEPLRQPDSPCLVARGEGDCSQCDLGPEARALPGITISHGTEGTTIARETCPTAPKFWHWSRLPLPRLIPREVEVPDDDDHLDEWKLQLVLAGVCGLLGLTGGFLLEGPWRLAAFGGAYLAGSWFAAEEVWELLRKRVLDVHFLMLAVAAGCASIGAWPEGATLLFLFSFSGAMEHYALGRTQREIRSLFKAAPKTAVVLDASGNEREEPVEQLRPGQRLLVRPDAQFPVDAEIAKGQSAADESNLTGEAAPVEKTVGDGVFAGTLNLWGAVEVTVTRPASESALEKIIHLIRESQRRKAPSQRFTDRFGSGYTLGALGLTVVMFFVWWLAFGLPPFESTAGTKSAFYRAMTLLVVASPCALVLSIPSAILAAIAWGARHGVLFRGGAAVEKLAEVDVVALDKTGTLTTGELQISAVESFPAGREAEILQLACSIEAMSNHPLARAITRHGKREGVALIPIDGVESLAGKGLRAKSAGKTVLLGKRAWVFEDGAPVPPSAPSAGMSEVWIRAEGLSGRIALRDEVRTEARATLERLKGAGIRSLVLTGDRQEAADELKRALAIDEVRAELTPEQKVAAIRELSDSGKKPAMIGDGVNDAPSLAAAHVAVAMGARGSDAALEQADVVLMHDRIENFWSAYQLSLRAKAVIKQNLFISLGTVVVLVTASLIGPIPLTLGVVGHEGSTVIVVLNSLRLLFGKTVGGQSK